MEVAVSVHDLVLAVLRSNDISGIDLLINNNPDISYSEGASTNTASTEYTSFHWLGWPHLAPSASTDLDQVYTEHLEIQDEKESPMQQRRQGRARPRTRPFRCAYCDLAFSSRNDLNRHQSSKHGEVAEHKYFCEVLQCRRSRRGFPRKDNMNAHRLRVHGLAPGESSGEVQSTEDIHNCSKQELVQMILQERERRLQIEREMTEVRERYERREDLWLRTLSRYTT